MSIGVRDGAIVFSQDFAGPLTVHARVLDYGGMSDTADDDFTYSPRGFGPPALPGFVSPAAGSGDSQRFEWTLLHAEGGENAAYGELEFASASESAYCTVAVNGDQVSLSRFLYDRNPRTRDRISSDPIRIGAVSIGPIVLENDLCSLDVTGMKDEVAGNARSLSALIGFKPAFAGPFSVAVGTTGSAVVRGSWHPATPEAGRGSWNP